MGVNVVKLGELCEILDSKRKPVSKKDRVAGEYPYYGATGIQDYVANYIFDESLVLVGEDGAKWGAGENTAYAISGKSWVNNHAHVLRPNRNKILDNYLIYYLNQMDLRPYITGAIIEKLNQEQLRNIEIPLPSIEEQTLVVSLMDKADEIRTKKRLANDKLDEFLKSTFISMFGDPVRNEKGLPLVNFSDMGTLARGKSKHRPRNAPELLGGEYPLIQTGDVANAGLYLRKYIQTYSELGLKQSKMWSAGTLCITIAANIAKTAIMTFDACFPDSVVGFINNDKCNIHYIQFWLMFLQSVLEAEAPQSAQKNINLEILNGLSLPYPPIEEQNKFAMIVEKVEAQKQKNEQIIEQMDNLFNSLSQRAFKGELQKNKKDVG